LRSASEQGVLQKKLGRILGTGAAESPVANPRLRWALCEAAWRLLKYQPQYRLCKKWRGQILPGGRKKQLIVALARGFGVDWWRLCTGQTTPDKLGLMLAD